MQIGILGPLRVSGDDGTPVDVPGARLRGLLAALALHPGRMVPKSSLIDWIWGEEPPADVGNALQRLVSRLRKLVPVEGGLDGYRLIMDPESVDAARFERLVALARRRDGRDRLDLLREALGLWRGAALQDIGLPDSEAVRAAATRLEGIRLAAQEDRYEAEVALGNGPDVVTELTDLVAAHPLRERLVASLLRALAAAGRDAEALQLFQRTREILAEELGADPSAELADLHLALLRGELTRQPEPHPDPADARRPGPGRAGAGRAGAGRAGAGRRRNNLRAELTSYVGKEDDLAAVRRLLGEHRLVTLLGPGGAGKTRLAGETGRALLDDHPDGVWLIELAAVAADGDVAQAVVSALGLRDALLGGTPNLDLTDRLISALRDQDMLLILDNCEHVIEAAAEFAYRLLGECPRTRILATSREPLGITGEALWQVAPLRVPEPGDGPGEIAAAPAVRLLRERAAAVRTDLTLDDDAALAAMARICRALDGMPLAIELAAARLRSMTPDQLAGRLDDRFRLLTRGSRTVQARHRTLRAVVDWSWELLSDPERRVLRRLSVFTGGAGLAAAEQVCGGDGVGAQDVLDLLGSLTEKSLLVADPGPAPGRRGPAPRYRLLGTIKEYAADRLAEAGETDRVRRAHLRYFTELTVAATAHLWRREQLDWLATLGTEQANIVAAMRAALAHGEAEPAMRLAAGAGWYWWLAGHKAEGLELITAALELPGEVPDQIRAMVAALLVQFLTAGFGDEQRAAHWIREATRLSRGLPEDQARHPALRATLPLERVLRDPAHAAEAFTVLLDEEDPWLRAIGRLHLGKQRALRGDGSTEVDAALAAALTEFRAVGERFGISFALTELADRIAARGEFARACAHYREAIAAVTEIGAVDDVIRMQIRLAQLLWLAGEPEASAAAAAVADRYADGATWPDTLAQLALARAGLARWNGDPDEARRQLGRAVELLEDVLQAESMRAWISHLRAYAAEDAEQARELRRATCRFAAGSGHPTAIAQVLVGVADQALGDGDRERAARLLGAAERQLGLSDRSNPDLVRIEREVRDRLGAAGYGELRAEGAAADWMRLVEETLGAVR